MKLRSKLVGEGTVLILGLCLSASLLAAPCGAPNIQDARTVKWVGRILDFAIGDDDACRASAPARDSLATRSACNIFVGRVLVRLYGIGNLTGPSGDFLKANDLAETLATSPDWEDLGVASNEAALNRAADAANGGYAVIAVWDNPGGSGHVALIGPGPLTPGWGGLKVPTASAITLNHPSNAFLGKPLSCAFGADKNDATHIYRYKQMPTGF